MEVTCTQCNAKLNIPDDKTPVGQTVRINCPKCKAKITIDTRESTPDRPPQGDPPIETGKAPPGSVESKSEEDPGEGASLFEDQSGDEALDFFSEDAELALVMISDDMGEKVRAAFEELGYKYIPALNMRDALGKLRFHHFNVILMADGFDGQGLAENPVINYLNHISMSSRRRIFLALLGDSLQTMDDVTAYAMSANVVINPKDAGKLSSVLKKGLTEYEKFYKVFMDTLVEVGKA